MRWSPDGRSILLVGWDSVGPDNRQGVYQLDVETGDVTPIVQSVPGSGSGYIGQAVWSPDGKVIFYTRRHRRQSVQIVVRNLETGQESELHGAAGLTTIGPGLAISPDGRYLAFTSSWSGTGAKSVSVIPTAGGEPRELHSVQGPERINEKVVAWTPDGRYVVFGKQTQTKDDTQGSTTRFWRVPAAGGEPEALGLAIEDPLDLRFHPDGRRVAFTSRVDIDEIWVMENFLPPDASGNE